MQENSEEDWGYAAPKDDNVEVLINIHTGESLVTEGTNMTYRQANNALPGCTHCMLRHESRFSYYEEHNNAWETIEEDDMVPPELKAFQMLL